MGPAANLPEPDSSHDSAPHALTIHEPELSGHSPRAQVVRDFVVAVQGKDLDYLRERLAPDVQWEIVGFQKLDGREQVLDWVGDARDIVELSFNGILTHGREAGVDGRVTNIRNVSVAFSFMIRFTGTADSARIRAVRCYLVSDPQ